MTSLRCVRPTAFVLCLLTMMATLTAPGLAQDKLRFGVGPLQPTPSETKKAYEPFFAYVAKQLATSTWSRRRTGRGSPSRSPTSVVALRDGRVVEDAATARLDVRAIDQIYERSGA